MSAGKRRDQAKECPHRAHLVLYECIFCGAYSRLEGTRAKDYLGERCRRTKHIFSISSSKTLCVSCNQIA